MASPRRARFTAHPVNLVLEPKQSIKNDAVRVSVAPRIDSVTPHTHDYLEIIYIYHGGGMHEIEGHRHPVTASQILFLPPGIAHSFPPVKNSWHKHAVISYRPDAFDWDKNANQVRLLISAVLREKKFLHPVSKNLVPAMEQTIATMFFESTMNQPDSAWIIRLEALKFIAYCFRILQGGDALTRVNVSNPVVNAALVNMESHYMRLRSVADIVFPSTINKKYFARLFKATIGMTPIDYLNRLRIEKCLEPITAAESAVIQEAYAVGFHDIAHFNRLFRRHLGMSPTVFKMRSRQGRIDLSKLTRFSFPLGK